jgi:hypothetical protein
MIDLVVRLSNPWSDRFKNLGHISGKFFTKNKVWELEHYFHAGSFLELECSFTTRQDHAGFRASFVLLGYGIGLTIYDIRHWDYEKDYWEIYDEQTN